MIETPQRDFARIGLAEHCPDESNAMEEGGPERASE